MFDSIVLRRAEGHSEISFGQIAEALLYYQAVHLFLDRGSLFGLMNQIGTERLLILIDRPEISTVYCEEMLATASDSAGISPYHQYLITVFAGTHKSGKLLPLQVRLEQELKLKGRPIQEAMRFSRAFVKKVPTRSFNASRQVKKPSDTSAQSFSALAKEELKYKATSRHLIPEGITNSILGDLSDTEYINKAVHDIINIIPGGYQAGIDFKFKVINTEIGMFVDTNLKLELINKKRAELIPPVEPLTIAQLLSYILDARADMTVSSHYKSDLATSKVSSSAIQAKCSQILKQSNINTENRFDFEDILLPECPAISEVINSGERTFDDFMKFLDEEAWKFKEWLKGVDPDKRLIHAYLDEIKSIPWINSLDGKNLRYLLTTGVGLIYGYVTISY